MRNRLIIKTIGTLFVGLIASTAMGPRVYAQASPRDLIISKLFSGPPPSRAAEITSAKADLAKQGIRLPNGVVTDTQYLASAKATTSCIESETGGKASEPRIVNARAVWTVRVGTGGPNQTPSPEIRKSFVRCSSIHLARIENLYRLQHLPSSSQWLKTRDAFLTCISNRASVC